MKTIAAYTPSSGYSYYPPYINIAQADDGKIVVTLRGNEYPDGKCGATDTATFDAEGFMKFLHEAAGTGEAQKLVARLIGHRADTLPVPTDSIERAQMKRPRRPR